MLSPVPPSQKEYKTFLAVRKLTALSKVQETSCTDYST